jgi:hypothetical protein
MSVCAYNVLWSNSSPLLLFLTLLLSHNYNFNGFHYSIFIHVYNYFDHFHTRPHHPLPSILPLAADPLSSLPFIFMSFFLIFCIWEKTCDTCLSESDLLHLTWWHTVPSIFLQMVWFHSSLWLYIVHFAYNTISLFTYQLMGTEGDSMAWLLWKVLL